MPQMMPMLWIFFFFLTLIIFIMNMSMLYFMNIPLLSILPTNMNKKNWFWNW